ncbi:hypothetical protein [Streptomyces vinaceus]|uniref:hypothetical protein n=1 Tax=Streptomyces vinaceus TaxID=1960 RepID=UPI0036B9E754
MDATFTIYNVSDADHGEIGSEEYAAAKSIHRALTAPYDRPTLTAQDLRALLRDEQNNLSSPTAAEGQSVTTDIARFYSILASRANDPAEASEILRLRREVLRALESTDLNTDERLYNRFSQPPIPPDSNIKPEPQLTAEDVNTVAPAAEVTIESSLARLFLRLGPPPQASEVDFMPAGRDGGGAQK